ncbi:MAG: DUF2127 domain-containing protein [Burkholderiaceae bacterium]|jgi:uncharacterized membrane protein (DUF2068 family)
MTLSAKTGLSLTDTAALRTIAVYEVVKAAVVVSAGFASIFLLRHDLQNAAGHVLRHLHVDPASRLSLAILEMALRIQSFDVRWIVLGSLVYAVVRLSESYGLWMGKAWGEWIGALSGAIYLPIEIREVLVRLNGLHLAFLLGNLAIVLYLCWHLWRRNEAKKRGESAALPPVAAESASAVEKVSLPE